MNFEFKDMAMGPERSSPLHNFTFPGGLRWGNQRSLRCRNVDYDNQVSPIHEFTSNGSDSSGHRRHHHHHQSIQLEQPTRDRDRDKGSSGSDFVFLGSHQMGSTPLPVIRGGQGIGDDDGNGIAAVRENVMLDRRKAVDDLRVSILKEGRKGSEVFVSQPPLAPHPAATSAGGGDTNRPWNLRKRRAVVGVNGGGSCSGVSGKGLRVDGVKPGSEISLIKAAAAAANDISLRSGGNVPALCGERTKRERFSVALSKREIEEDFLSFTGHKPPRRSKKRAKFVQRQFDTLFPGLWLREVTPELYKVSESAP